MPYHSQLIERAIEEISRLPGIGRKSAVRIVLYLLKQPTEQSRQLAESLLQLREQIRYCKQCHNIADDEQCGICSDPFRQQDTICVVEHFKDIIAIENTAQYRGLYHVLGGLISPVEGIGPEQLHIESLLQRIENNMTKEVILAFSATMEGDTTALYLTKKLKKHSIKVTTLARGVPIGSEIEYTDELTLARSLLGRIEF